MGTSHANVGVVGDVDLLRRLQGLEGIQVAWSGVDAESLPEDACRSDVAIVDLSLPPEVALDSVRAIAVRCPDTGILVVQPEDAPSDGAVRALDAGADGFVALTAPASDMAAAIHTIGRGDAWLSAGDGLALIRDVAPELETTTAERTGQLWSIVLALVPIVGGVAAFLSFVGRKYWGSIGVRPVDIAVDPGTRVVDVLLALSMLVGVLGPLVLITAWLDGLSEGLDASPSRRRTLDRLQTTRLLGVPVGRALFSRAVAWWILALAVLGITITLATIAPLVVVLLVGPAIGISLLARTLDLDQDLPGWLRSDRVKRESLLAGSAAVVVVAMVFVGSQALSGDPDLRTDGVHGFVATEVLGFSAQPVLATNVDGARPPIEVLYLGGNADLYVLYDPCADIVEFVSVGSTHIQVIDEVSCP